MAIVGAFFAFAPESEPGFGQTELPSGSIVVGEPTDSTQVTVAAELSAPGYITVHESMGAAPGNTIATSSYLESPVYHQLTLFTDPEMTPGLNYIILLHADDGDRVFDLNNDSAVIVDGEVVRADFTVEDSK